MRERDDQKADRVSDPVRLLRISKISNSIETIRPTVRSDSRGCGDRDKPVTKRDPGTLTGHVCWGCNPLRYGSPSVQARVLKLSCEPLLEKFNAFGFILIVKDCAVDPLFEQIHGDVVNSAVLHSSWEQFVLMRRYVIRKFLCVFVKLPARRVSEFRPERLDDHLPWYIMDITGVENHETDWMVVRQLENLVIAGEVAFFPPPIVDTGSSRG
ncbi:hypothetical protein [Rhizobium sp. WYJ-E13]|uniref:hypothetical protein n=1 Tax=Rhizobium sp. WYJ-E13 TaxID=2849093 RepID=UPI001C1EF699|nr:hypothetical protein [Rhizobium sp. WYJ-E13]QWW72575.1 hypothetical protein KQ933_32220 [Rhizobium sp. WYJ-E13]